MRNDHWGALLAAAFLTFTPDLTSAQTRPPAQTRPLTIVVGNAPGNAIDLMSRLLAPEMSKILGIPVIVENKVGAQGLIAYSYVATVAPADGRTILASSDVTAASYGVTVKDLQFDPVKDLPAIINLTTHGLDLVSSKVQPWQTFDEFAAYAKAHPGELNYSVSSPTNVLNMEYLFWKRGLKVERINYNSTQQSMLDMIKGVTHVTILTDTDAVAQKEQINVLAQTGSSRNPAFPNAPTFAEIGVPQLSNSNFTFVARSGTPPDEIAKIYRAASEVVNSPEVKEKLAKMHMEVAPLDEQSGAWEDKHLAEVAEYDREAARQAHIEPQ